ncbi:MAG: succinate dehydrogenase iron-sulfur subunit [Deltaproteobacteria bacterium]|jgi:succinate dehydrogenase / fumarate reductase iron-sulfur subunit|nr:succinate dehydrogenase iron-sulfur subunit [Deltaproteobacteria bacterium]MBW2541096.1 succinate dehydrogenase iron-sulfur subunit [Deltaproteobacteria bacterium]
MASKVTMRIQRFDPAVDEKPHDQDFEIELPAGITILKALNKVRAEKDPTLALRYSCGSAICGSCAMKVNGHARLACKTQVSDCTVDGVLRIAPMGNLKILRDLVVDMDPFFDSLGKAKPYLEAGNGSVPEFERKQRPEEFLQIDPSTTCILCAACYSDCNVLEVDDNFFGPATLAKAHRFIFDSRDVDTQARLRAVSKKTGVWDCTHCGECSTRCPTETKPLERIEEIRTKAMADGFHDNVGARHALGFRETVGKRGILDENYLPARSMGFFNLPGLLSLVPIGLRMMMRGKNPPLIPHKIDKLEEVKKTFARFEELRK